MKVNKLFELANPNFNTPYVIGSMNCSDNYYERMDFELLKWDSVVAVVDQCLSLQEMLEKVWDKYPILTLSFILRKSTRQIQQKMSELGLKYAADKTSTELAKKKNGKYVWNKDKLYILIEETENHEIEHWLIQNNNYQNFDKKQVDIENFDPTNTLKYYLENGDYETAFKLMVNICNFLRIPYSVDFEGGMVHYSIVFHEIRTLEFKQSQEIIDKIQNTLLGNK